MVMIARIVQPVLRVWIVKTSGNLNHQDHPDCIDCQD